MLANRKAAREEEIESHGKQIIFRKKIHIPKTVYNTLEKRFIFLKQFIIDKSIKDMKFRIKREHYHNGKVIYVPQFKKFLFWWPFFETIEIGEHFVDWPAEFNDYNTAKTYLKRKMSEKIQFIDYENIENDN